MTGGAKIGEKKPRAKNIETSIFEFSWEGEMRFSFQEGGGEDINSTADYLKL